MIWGRKSKRIAHLERELAKRNRALVVMSGNARWIELTAASFGLGRITEPRIAEIEDHARFVRLTAEPLLYAVDAPPETT